LSINPASFFDYERQNCDRFIVEQEDENHDSKEKDF